MTQPSDPVPSPTDQRIAELEDFVGRWQARARDAERLLKAAEQRLEQVTKEREELRKAIAHIGDIDNSHLPHAYVVGLAKDQAEAEDELNRDGGVKQRLESAEATIARLKGLSGQWRHEADEASKVASAGIRLNAVATTAAAGREADILDRVADELDAALASSEGTERQP